jgi:FkbM family methyltransferase
MADSRCVGMDMSYPRGRLDWIQLAPFSMEGALHPLQLDLLTQAARDFNYQRYQRMAAAADAARRLFGVDNDLGMTLSNIGLAAASLGDLAAAFEALKTARDRWPEVVEHHYNCGVLVLKFSDDLETAETCLARGVEIGPDHGPSWLALAIIRLERGDHAGCVEAARRAIALDASPNGSAALCLAAALERLGLEVAWPAWAPEAGLASPEAFHIVVDKAPRTVLSVALGDQEALAALRLAEGLDAASGWSAHLHLCNVSAAMAETIGAWAKARPQRARVSIETLVTDPAASLAERFGLIRLRTLAAFGAAVGGDVIMAHPRLVFTTDPEGLLPDAEQGVSLLIEDGLLWNQVGQDLIGVRAGPAADAVLADLRYAALPWPWSDAPVAAGAWLWRAWTQHPSARRLTREDLASVVVEADMPPPDPTPPRVEFNEIVPSRYGPMLLNRNDLYVFAGICETGVWSAEEMDLLASLIQPGQTVLDVGANMGSHALAFCNFVGPTGTVHAFEPQRIMFQALVATVALNNWTNAHCHMKLVGARRGKMRLPSIDYGEPSNFGMMTLAPDRDRASSLTYRDDEVGEEVERITLDSLDLAACHLIKIDVEGMEIDVLRGARRTIARHRPLIYMECQPDKRSQASLKLLKSLGYATWWHGHIGSLNILGAPLERPVSAMGLKLA